MLVHTKTNTLILNAEDPFAVRAALHKSRLLAHTDYNVAVQHTLEATKVLRNLGFDAPAPIRYQYSWPGKFTPFAHQYTMAEFLTLHRRAFNLSEMGSAKTNASLWAADWLIQTKRVRKVLILSPLSTLKTVWLKDIFDTLMHRSAVIVHGTREKRLAALQSDVDFYIMNHDGVKLKYIEDYISRRPDIDLIIVDEASMFRNSQTAMYKALARIVSRPELRLWLMTGTPCPNEPTDAWALARLVSPERVPKFFGTFQRETMMKVSQYRWVPRADAFDRAFQAMQPAVRFRKRDCIDLPPVTTQDHQCDLSPEQAAQVKELKNHMRTIAKERNVTAANAADQINKMRQILCGAIKVGDDDYVTVPHEPRTRVLLDAIRSASAKVIVVCPFKGIQRQLVKEIEDGGFSCALINGDVPPTKRNQIIEKFKTETDPHVLICHPKVASHGLNLTEADTLIFYAPIYSNDEFQQVLERFNRAGQTRKMTVIRMGAHPLEWKIYDTLDGRGSAQNVILDLYKIVTE